jgi:hypothetical protein
VAQPASYLIWFGGSFSDGKAVGRELNCLPPSSAHVKNEWSTALVASWQRQTQLGLFDAHNVQNCNATWPNSRDCKHLLIVRLWEFLFRIMELCRIFTIHSFFAFLLVANNHCTVTPYSPIKQVSWWLTHGLNLVPHHHTPGHSEDLHSRPNIPLV